jgi:HK97 family phage portal protein
MPMSLITGLLSRTAEDPRHALTAEALSAYFGTQATSGESITTEKALKYAPVFRAVQLISSSVGRIPIIFYRRSESGKERATDDPRYSLLRYKPNEQMTAKPFKETLTAHVLLKGNGYAYIYRDKYFKPVELYPLDPDKTYPVRENGRLWYVTELDTEIRKIEPYDMIHIKGLGWDGLQGFSVVSYATDSIGHGRAIHKYSSIFFKNSARPSVVLETPNTLSTEAISRLKSQWDYLYSGLDNSHKTAVLEEGLKANPFSTNANDAQMVESMKFSIVEISNWFSIPPHKLGDSSRTAYNSLEQENQSFLDECLDSWLVSWEEELYDKLLTEDEKAANDNIIEFKREAILRADLNARANYFRTALGGTPWMKVNEVRNAENMNDAGDEYDSIILPKTSAPQTQQIPATSPAAPAVPQEVEKEDGDDEQKEDGAVICKAREILDATAGRVYGRLAFHAKKHPREKLVTDHRAVCVEMLAPVVALCNMLGAECKSAEVMFDEALEKILFDAAAKNNAETKNA